jgi:hypothetical protein
MLLRSNKDFAIEKSEFIINNHHEIVQETYKIYKKYQDEFNNDDSTWNYYKYNIFALSSPSVLYYEIFLELVEFLLKYFNDGNRYWFQSWLNFHSKDDVLDWHNHKWPYHGYICIDPKNSRTIFENYSIKNEIGNIYLGKGHRKHKVEVLEDYDDFRITIGFDICDESFEYLNGTSFIPLIQCKDTANERFDKEAGYELFKK